MIKAFKFTPILLSLIALAGCTSPPTLDKPVQYKVGEMWMPPEEESEVCVPKTTAEKALRSFKKPLGIKELTYLALNYSPTIRSTYFESRYYRSNIGVAQAAYFPSVTVTATASRDRESSINSSDHVTTTEISAFEPKIGLSYTLYDFGTRRAALDESRAQYEYEALTYNRLIQQVRQEVSAAYWGYLAAIEILEDDKKDYDDYVKLVEITKRALDAGTITKDTYLLARTEMLGAQLTYSDQINTVKTALYELKQLIGLPSDVEMEIETGLPDCEEITIAPLKDLLLEAKEVRPDYLALQKLVTSAEASISSAKAAFFPTLSLDASYDKSYYSRGPNPSYELTGELVLSYDLFSGFDRSYTLRGSRNMLQVARANVEAKEADLSYDVAVARETLYQSNEELGLARAYLDASIETFHNTLDSFAAGINTVIDVITAQNTLSTAREKYTQTKKQWFVSRTDLAYAVGKEDE